MITKIMTITAKQKLVPESVAIRDHLFVASGEINCKNKRNTLKLTQYCILSFITACHITSRHVISFRGKSSQVKSHYVMASRAPSGLVMACHIKSSQVG